MSQYLLVQGSLLPSSLHLLNCPCDQVYRFFPQKKKKVHFNILIVSQTSVGCVFDLFSAVTENVAS